MKMGLGLTLNQVSMLDQAPYAYTLRVLTIKDTTTRSYMMGKILMDRNSINLHLELLYTPKFSWRNSDLKPLYQMTITYVDLK
ncbi:MAG: RMD1 family protein [Gammaproteobacteria bacterium]|nr:RMD1 family protein [Gammaproteobacteria bacterium]